MRTKHYLVNQRLSPYEILEQNYAKWQRISFDYITVSTQGYCGESCMILEDELKRAKVFATKRRYNAITGETVTTYKLQGSFK